ncbi:adenylosuccinate synthetase domain-containing protein [Trichoderma breve]|uniref:Adenylosuccinate synthetase n=1 Tax=Trichoderma breve TaxID=2034170 RepID=A0A9W9BCE8_9HYPO|nr:adenylosuccinate synthetase domain-containing protein [Trichoderma breve]KAJ4857281.1 adenylosuccinate synthetase domain-containing protein [Trichoderma breve]
MPIKVVLGAQWGDEGKGKLVDILAPEAQLCARAAGGHNAGHSIVANGVSYSFHLLPSGLINPNCMNFIGSDVPSFFSELKQLEEKGLPNVYDRILVSDRVHINFDLHAAVDGLEEIELGERKIGTTGRGIINQGCSDVFDQELFESKLRRLAHGYKARYGDLLKYDVEEEIKRFRGYRTELAKYAIDGLSFMYSAQTSNMNIIIEGANAVMLDLSMGSYPYVTSSNTAISGIIAGLTLNPKAITETIGVVKAYTTRVGAGAFKTEDLEEVGTKLQEVGREWGTSTGRKRRCGWLDLVVVKHGHMVNYYTALNLTKLDVLDSFETIKIAIAYKDKSTGQDLDYYPADHNILDNAEVVYHEMPGWNKPTTNARTYDELPKQAQDYIEYIEKFIGVKVKWIGTGPDREAMITRN